jgi:hypothetical protein
MSGVTDHDLAQATVLISALRAEIADMAHRLARTDRESTCGHSSRDRARRQQAAQLRRDINQAQFLITRLHHRFPRLDPAAFRDATSLTP